MGLKAYSVTLEESLVTKAKSMVDHSSGKLSPILNRLLEEWVERKKQEKIILSKVKWIEGRTKHGAITLTPKTKNAK